MTKDNRELASADALERAKSNLESARLLSGAGKYAEAVSLAYYAAFRAVRALLVSRDLQPKTHQGLLHLFNLHFVATKVLDARLFAELSRAQHDRLLADYEPSATFDASAAQREIALAEELLAECKRVLGSA